MFKTSYDRYPNKLIKLNNLTLHYHKTNTLATKIILSKPKNYLKCLKIMPSFSSRFGKSNSKKKYDVIGLNTLLSPKNSLTKPNLSKNFKIYSKLSEKLKSADLWSTKLSILKRNKDNVFSIAKSRNSFKKLYSSSNISGSESPVIFKTFKSIREYVNQPKNNLNLELFPPTSPFEKFYSPIYASSSKKIKVDSKNWKIGKFEEIRNFSSQALASKILNSNSIKKIEKMRQSINEIGTIKKSFYFLPTHLIHVQK